jgi:hypothetical protein
MRPKAARVSIVCGVEGESKVVQKATAAHGLNNMEA